MDTALMDFISKVGFPIFVATYYIFRLEPVLRELDKSIKLLTVVVAMGSGHNADDIKQKFIGSEKS